MNIKSILPGLLVCLAAAVVGLLINTQWPVASALLVAILAGVGVGNVMTVPQSWQSGTKFAAKPLLRAGIVLLGFKVALGDILGLGWGVVVLVLAIVGIGVVASYFIGRALGIDEELSMLVACGFSICGAAAVAAVEGVIKPKSDRVAMAIALVVLYGTLMIPIGPALTSLAHLNPQQAAIWIGGGTHEVAQVVASAGIVGKGVLVPAVIVKLARVLMLAPMMVGVAVWQRRRGTEVGERPPLMPLFVALFIVAVIIRSLVPIPESVMFWIGQAQTLLLAMAMFALGLSVNKDALKATGSKALLMGLLSTLLVNAIAFGGALLVA